MNRIINDRESMSRLMTGLSSMVSIANRLPALVFRPGYDRFRFLEFDVTTSERFWNVLSALAVSSQDSHVNLIVLEPDPIDYFFKRFHKYGALRFEVNASPNDYSEGLETAPANSPADALLYNSEVIAWFPDSCNWALWGERSRGVAVLGVKNGCSISVESILREASLPNVSVDQALMDFVSMNFKDTNALEEFSWKLEQNYWQAENGQLRAEQHSV